MHQVILHLWRERPEVGWNLAVLLPVPLSDGIAGMHHHTWLNLPFQTEVLMWAPAEIGVNVASLKGLVSVLQNESSFH